MRLGIITLIAGLLAGCAAPGPHQADRYYVLAPTAGRQTSLHSAPPIEVLPTTAATFYDTQDMAFSREPGTRSYYQFNHWIERPQHAIHRELAARFERVGRGNACMLATHLDEMYHDAVSAPGSSHVTITAKFLDSTRAVVAQRAFTRSAQASSYDAAGAARAFDQTLDEVLDEIVAWVDAQVAAEHFSRAGGACFPAESLADAQHERRRASR
jgi:ABC-type uncharacterized transport system auxiliary subunit